MIVLTDRAADKVATLLAAEDQPDLGLRVWAESGGCAGLEYRLAFVPAPEDGDVPVDGHAFPVYVEGASLAVLVGARVDYAEGLRGAGFTFDNPNAARSCGCGTSFTPADPTAVDPDLVDRVEAELDLLRPFLAADGGSVELVGIHASTLAVRLGGACGGCSSAATTTKVVEDRLRRALPEIERVIVA